MNVKNPSPLLRRSMEIVVTAALYYLVAWPGLILALPSTSVTALWPSSGLALAALLIVGWHTSLGIFAGSFLFHLTTMNNPAALPAIAAMAGGATLEAWIAAWLLRRFIKTLPPETIRQTVLAIGLTGLVALLAPAIQATSLCRTDLAAWSDYTLLMWSGWIGNFTGILIFTPLLIVFSTHYWQKRKIKEPFLWPLTCVIISLALLAFFTIRNNSRRQMLSDLKNAAEEVTQVLQNRINHDIQAIAALRAFYAASEKVEPGEFSAFTTRILKGDVTAFALSWNQRVPQSERLAYEQIMRQQVSASFYIYEKDPQNNNIPAAERSEYFPITLIEPFTSNLDGLGFDYGSNPERLETLIRARDHGEAAATVPLQLVQETGNPTSVVIMLPVYRSQAIVQTVADRQANLLGIVSGAFHITAWFEKGLKGVERRDLELYLYDASQPDLLQFLAFYPSISGVQTLPVAGPPPAATVKTGTYQTTTLTVADHDWVVVARPGPAFFSKSDGLVAWGSLLLGLMVTGAFLGYVYGRQKTEAILAHSEVEFRTLSENALTGIAKAKPGGEIIYANKALAQIFGSETPQDLPGKKIFSFMSDTQQVDTALQMLHTSGQLRNHEVDILTNQGEKRHILCSAALYEGILTANLIDITERIRSEKELRQLSRIVAQIADSVVITDVNGVIEYVNPAFEQLSGYSRLEALGQTPRLVKSGIHPQNFYQQLWDTILRGEVFQGEIVNRKKNGELYYETKTITPIRDAEGAITHFAATGKDITERKKIEDTLKQREQEYRLIAENTGDIIWILDLESQRFTYISPAVKKMLGYTPQEVMHGSLSQILMPAALKKVRSILSTNLAAFTQNQVPITQTEELAQVRKDGIRVDTETTLTMVLNDAGKVQVVGISRDITERKQAAILQETVYRIAEAAQATESLQDLYPQIQRHIASIMYAENFYIALYDETKDLLRFTYFIDEKDQVTTEPFHPRTGLTVQVLRTGQPLLFIHADQAGEVVGTPCKSWLGVPLITQGKTIGVMAVQHYADPQAFTEREQRILEFVSSQVAVAIERQQALENLQKSQSNLEMAQSTAHLGSWQLDPHTGIGFWSKEMFHLFHRDPEQDVPVLSEFLEMIHPDDRRVLLQAQQEAIDSGEIITAKYRSNPFQGEKRYFKTTLQAVKDAQGQFLQMAGTVLDITEVEQANEQLRESEQRLKQAQQIAHIGSWEFDIQRYEIKWSNELYRMFDLDPQKAPVTYETFLQAIHPNDRDRVNQAYAESIATHSPYEVIYRIVRSDGSIRFVQEKCETYYDENGTPLRSLGTAQDITEHRQMELAVQERMKELTCLFAVSRLIEDRLASQDALCNQVIEYLVPAMQYPQMTIPFIELDGQQYTTPDYTATLTNCLSAPILINNEARGQVSVCYTRNESFLLPEEQNLINNVARMLGLWFEQKQTETALRASDERFRQLADNIQEVFWIYNLADKKFIYISPAYEVVWGRSCTSLYQNAHEQIESLLPEDRPILLAALEKETRGESIEVEYRIQRPDGSIRWVWDRSFPIFDEQGRLMHHAGMATDITDLKNIQHKLEDLNRDLERRVEERTTEVRQSEATYRALFENSNDGIFLISPTGVELQANQQALSMLGYTAEEYYEINRYRPNVITPPEQQTDANVRFQAVLRGEQVPLYERTFIRKDGQRIHVEINLSAVRDTNGQVILVQSVVRDITARKKAEEALRESRDKLSIANAALEKASRLKDEFLASMSHELRTPLTGILGLSEALQLQTYGALNEKQLKSIKNIESSGRHLLDLINDILDLSKIEAGKLELQIGACSVAEVCQTSLQLVKGMAHQKKQNISFSMNPISITLNADMRRLKQMLVNLLSNAVKFTPDNGSLGLEVQGDPEAQVVRLSVWDKGIGIRPEEMSKLFRPFVQLDSSLARQYSGTGLGLSLVQRMAELHGGSIQVESVPNEGSRFTLILPWVDDLTQPEPVGREMKETDASSVKSTMVIEDNLLDVEHIQRYLKDIGIVNIVQPVLRGALEKAAALHPSVILLDLNLPDGSGLDFITQLKANDFTRDIPVIITSVEERRTEAMQRGASGYLLKPFVQQELKAELAKAAAFIHPSDPVLVIASPTSGPLVLLADDNEMILETVGDFLESRGYRVVATRSGFELLERAPEVSPAIMLVDIQMPGMDGLETMRRLRAHSDPLIASIPIIAVTALAMSGDREKCLQAGANEYVSKPIVLSRLVKQIEQLLKKTAP